jgi:outer membrane protein OmpA-like peptidoglycan-associated protein
MRRTFPLQVLLAAGLLIAAGCASKSSPPQAGTTTDNSRTSSYSKASSKETPSTKPEEWNYQTLPTPAPSKKPTTRLNEIAFADNDASLNAEATAVCREIARRLKEAPGERALVVGFTHYREKDAALGLRRAEKVRDCLVSQGVERGRLEVANFGSQFSSSGATDALQRKQPQAAEVWLLSK